MHIRVSARAIVIHDGHILLNCFGNGVYFNFPGGGLEPGECAPEAVVREVLEESGLHVQTEHLVFTLEYEPARCDNFHGSQHGMSLFFRCKLLGSAEITAPLIPDQNPDDPSLQSHAKWVAISDLPQTPFVPDTILEPLLKYIDTGVFEPSYFEHYNPQMR